MKAGTTDKVTRKQARCIPLILSELTVERGCAKAAISKQTFYKWRKSAAFCTEFQRQGDEIAHAAFVTIKLNVERAAMVLVSLLGTKDPRVKRLAANNLLEHYVRYRELDELSRRMDRIENRLSVGTPGQTEP